MQETRITLTLLTCCSGKGLGRSAVAPGRIGAVWAALLPGMVPVGQHLGHGRRRGALPILQQRLQLLVLGTCVTCEAQADTLVTLSTRIDTFLSHAFKAILFISKSTGVC